MSGKTHPDKTLLERIARFDFIVLFLVLYFCFNTVSIVYVNGDTGPAVFLPLVILNQQTVFFDQLSPAILQSPNYDYAFPEVNGHRVSLFPIVTPVLIIPVYGIQELMAIVLNIPISLDMVAAFAKVSASIIAAASSTLVYLVLKELFSRRIALITTFVYAFATSTWVVGSQALWQHGMVQLLLIFLVYCIIRNERKSSVWWIIAMGSCSGLFIFNRPPDAVLLIPIIVYIVKNCQQHIAPYIGAGILTGFPFLTYNVLIFGNIFGGYQKNLGFFNFTPDAITGFVSLLFAPNLGLFIFSPVLLLAIAGYFKVDTLNRPVIELILKFFGPVMVLLLAVYSFFGLWSSSTAFSYGQRFLTGLIPILALYMGFVFRDVFDNTGSISRARVIQVAVILLIFISVVIQAIGVFLYPMYPEKTMDTSLVWDTDNLLILNSYEVGMQTIPVIRMVSFGPLPPVFTIPIQH